MSVVRLAEAVDMDKGKISRVLAGLVPASWMVAGGTGAPSALAGSTGKQEAVLLGYVDRPTDTAAKMLEAENDLN
jgi:hypothetical protein